MLSDDRQSPVPEQPEQLTIGQRLRRAREQLNYSQQQVAQRLCIKSVLVQQIEQDCMPSGLTDTFMRGYIRSYARLVKIPAEDLLPVLTYQPLERPLKKGWQRLSLRRRHEDRLMIVTWLVVFILLALAGGWWWQCHRQAREEFSLLAHSLLPEITPQKALEQRVLQVPVENQDATVQDQPTVIDASVEKSSEQSHWPGDTAQLRSKAIQTSPSLVPAQAVPTEKVMSQAVVFDFNDACWLEISDAHQRLFSGLKHKGDRLVFNGQAPYQIALGAPQAVELAYKGKPIELRQYKTLGQIARFTLLP